ncbi:EamA family transporter [Streptomyces phaeochromogenes]|uniref:EamA family transporter n=1 Tax=Streptomyces phaeochromogenes TaxID=1923 RepID=UPI002DD9F441|nr:EamA family transporter [Streptomyces phaeochromogenes]WRZ26761.1 EamA family transporter [Streptomyces phaeochromogenes]WSJ10873.1 EamA family transporter [Streptomyces phaeochromogenes]
MTSTEHHSTATTAAPVLVRHPAGRGTLGGVGLVLAGAVSVQFGSAFAALLFPRVGALGVVALRVTLAAVLLLAITRPGLRGYSRADWAVAGGFGLALGGMNVLFYQAIDRIPLGAAVTLEVLGPLLLSVVVSRRAAGLLWAALALAGVCLLGRGAFAQLDVVGVAFALSAGGMWAAYIVLNARAGARFPRLDALAIAMAVAALVSLPLGIGASGGMLLEPGVLALGLAIAIMSSGVPYTLELLALRRLPAATFAVLTSLAPALAAMAGYLVLDQGLSPSQCAAIALVVAASAGAVRTGSR